MKHRTESLKMMILLLQVLGLVITLVGSAIGGLYIFNGQLLYALPLSIGFVFAMFYLVSFFMKEKENRRRKGYSNMFYMLFLLYALLGVVVSFFVLHFYNVEVNEKEEIRALGNQKLSKLELMHDRYTEQYENFCNNMQTSIPELLRNNKEALERPPYNMGSDHIRSLEQNTVNQTRNIKEKVDGVRVLFHDKKLELQNGNEAYFEELRNTLNQWNRLKIASALNSLSEKLKTDFNILNEYFQQQSGAPFLFEIRDTSSEILLNKPIALSQKHFGVSTIAVLIVFQLLILLPYFLTRGRQY